VEYLMPLDENRIFIDSYLLVVYLQFERQFYYYFNYLNVQELKGQNKICSQGSGGKTRREHPINI
jgi:hypothetical protein